MDNPIAHKDLDKEYKQIKKMRRTKEQSAKAIVVQTQEACDRFLEPYLEASRLITNKETPELSNQMFTSPPMISPPPKSSQQSMDELQQKLYENTPKRDEHTIDTLNDKPAYLSHPITTVTRQQYIQSEANRGHRDSKDNQEHVETEKPPLESEPQTNTNNQADDNQDSPVMHKSWDEMMRMIGIK